MIHVPENLVKTDIIFSFLVIGTVKDRTFEFFVRYFRPTGMPYENGPSYKPRLRPDLRRLQKQTQSNIFFDIFTERGQNRVEM